MVSRRNVGGAESATREFHHRMEGFVVMLGIGVAGCAVGAFALVERQLPLPGGELSGAVAIGVGVTLALLGLVLAGRASFFLVTGRPALILDAHGLRLGGVVRSRQISWSDVQGILVVPARGGGGASHQHDVVLHLRDGGRKRLDVSAMGDPSLEVASAIRATHDASLRGRG